TALDDSLHPRGPDLLYDLVGQLRLPPEATVIDLGCGRGRHAIALAERFAFSLHGVDPVPRNIAIAGAALREAAARTPALSGRVAFAIGRAETLPVRDSSADLVWCREVIYVI